MDSALTLVEPLLRKPEPYLLITSAMLGLGAAVAVQGLLPFFRRQPLQERLAALTVEGAREREEQLRAEASVPIFQSPVLEELLGRPLRRAGEGLHRLLASLSLAPADLEERLARAGMERGVAAHYGQKLFWTVLAFAGFMALSAFVALPLWLWLVMAALGFYVPDWQLAQRLRRRQQQMLTALGPTVDAVATAVAAGMAADQALLEVARSTPAPLGEALRRVLREAMTGGRSVSQALEELARREGLLELALVADVWRATEEAGIPMGPRLLELSRQLREAWRVRLREMGSAASVHMLVPVAIFILPTLLIVLLYPAALQLLGLGGQ